MQAPQGPSSLLWVKVPILVKHRFRDFIRWARKDKTTVYCIEDLIQPPPPYQAVRRNPPARGELDLLRIVLYYYRRQLFIENGIDREVLSADIESLHRWIEQLEYLVYWEMATTIPARYRHEPIKSRIIKRIKNLRREISNAEDDEFLGDEII
ncbi:hypothetical protein V8C42DRAFT_67320 [Trichoderma barbatum]